MVECVNTVALCPSFGRRAFCKEVIVLSARQRGTLCVFLAAVLYSIGGLFIKLIPWGGMAINGGRTAVALVVIGLYLKLTGHRPKMNLWVLVGALAVCGTNILFSIANKLTTAGNAIVLQFTAPIFVILFSVLFFGKRPQRLDMLACGLVLGGVLLFFIDSLSAGGMLGNVLALLSGISYAGVFLMNDMPDSDPISSVFWGDVISAVVGLPFLGYETDFSGNIFVALLVLGVFCGTYLWWGVLTLAASMARKKAAAIDPARMNRIFGFILCLLGAGICFQCFV